MPAFILSRIRLNFAHPKVDHKTVTTDNFDELNSKKNLRQICDFFFFSLAVLIPTLFQSQEAQAGRGGAWGTSEQMSLIAPTEIEDDAGQKLALCHLTKKTHILFAGVWRSSIGYVMAPNLCDSDRYYKLTADKLELGKVLGDFPADLPQQPVMSRADMLSGFWGLGVIALIMTLAGFRKAGQARRLTPLPSETDGIPPAAMRAMDAMCHAAKADGKLHPSEITLMADIALQITGELFDEARIRRMFDAAEAKPTAAQFAAFGTGLTSDQRRMVLRAALMIAAADGRFDHHETAFVYKLARGLNILTDEVAEMLHEMRAKAV